MIAAVLSGFVLALMAPGVVRLARGASGWLLALLPAALTVYFVRHLGPVAAGRTVAVSYPWAPDLGELACSLRYYPLCRPVRRHHDGPGRTDRPGGSLMGEAEKWLRRRCVPTLSSV